MPESRSLQRRLLDDYDFFVRRLQARLGSTDAAREAVHETFVKLESFTPASELQNPRGYIFRMAMNVASDQRRSANRLLQAGEADALLTVPDEAPDALRTVTARMEIEHIRRVLDRLPARRRAVFLDAWGRNLEHAEIARHYRVSLRTVQHDLQIVIRELQKALDRPAPEALRERGARSSRSETPVNGA